MLGTIPCSDKSTNPNNYDIWEYNDICTQEIIRGRVEKHQKHLISNCTSAHHMWTNPEKINQSTGHRLITDLMCELNDLCL